MFGKRITLFRLFGFAVGVDFTWILLAILIVWSLGASYFPFQYPGLDRSSYWWMAIAGAFGLFFSIVFHEFSHALVARRIGLPISGITLFLFGGVAHMESEPDAPKDEFLMAVAGPIASFVLAGIFYAIYAAADWPVAGSAVLVYLAIINALLAGFNLIPAFPLDGGRMLRAVLWGWKGNFIWASRIAARAGSIFGIILILLGVWAFVTGNFVGGMWWFLIGLFLRGVAEASFQQSAMRATLKGLPVRRIMNAAPVTVSPDLSVADLVENYFYRHYYKTFPVVQDDRLVGCVHLRDMAAVPRSAWQETRVSDIMRLTSSEETLTTETDALEALSKINGTNTSRMPVVDARDGTLKGILSLKDIMRAYTFRMEVEGEGAVDRRAPSRDEVSFGARDAGGLPGRH